jgi:hypothetical protein
MGRRLRKRDAIPRTTVGRSCLPLMSVSGDFAAQSQVAAHLATLRVRPGRHDLALAERLASSLRELVVSTATASAGDRAQVRAAVHYFVMRRRRLARSLVGERRLGNGDLRVVNETARRLGREDLMVEHPGPGAVADPGRGVG